MEDLTINSKIIKRIDIYENKEEIPPLKEERKNFIQNKMARFYKLIKTKDEKYNPYLFISDTKGAIYIYEFCKDNKFIKIANFDSICKDSKYILVDIIKSDKYDYYISLNLNPCINIFRIKNENKEIEILQHINLKNKNNKIKYYKVFELNTKKRDYFTLFNEDKIELWAKNNNKDIVQYEKIYTLLYENYQNFNNEGNNNNEQEEDENIKTISNIYKVDDESIVLLDRNKLEFIFIKLFERNNNIVTIEIVNNIKIKGIESQFEKINSLFVDKDYIFLGLNDSLILVSVPYGEKIQKYKIGKILQIKKINDEKDTIMFVETKENEFYFIKYKFEEFNGLKEESRIKYNKWIYKFDMINNGEIIAIYDIKGLITLVKLK